MACVFMMMLRRRTARAIRARLFGALWNNALSITIRELLTQPKYV